MNSSTIITLTQKLLQNDEVAVTQQLLLTAEDRTRSRHRFETSDGQAVFLQLPRGTVLQDGDVLGSAAGDIRVKVVAKPEPVLTVMAEAPLQLLQAAYHLGNRHVPLEITPHYLRLSPDSVLQDMLQQRGLKVFEETSPFHPEGGAYGGPHHGGHHH